MKKQDFLLFYIRQLCRETNCATQYITYNNVRKYIVITKSEFKVGLFNLHSDGIIELTVENDLIKVADLVYDYELPF